LTEQGFDCGFVGANFVFTKSQSNRTKRRYKMLKKLFEVPSWQFVLGLAIGATLLILLPTMEARVITACVVGSAGGLFLWLTRKRR
jgi:hypothetical protein